jgi:hypothetical protein
MSFSGAVNHAKKIPGKKSPPKQKPFSPRKIILRTFFFFSFPLETAIGAEIDASTDLRSLHGRETEHGQSFHVPKL